MKARKIISFLFETREIGIGLYKNIMLIGKKVQHGKSRNTRHAYR